MADAISLTTDQLAWLPSTDTLHLVELNYADQPVAGILMQGGQHYLYQRVIDLGEGWDVYAYVLLEGDEAGELAAASAADLPGLLDRHLTSGRPMVLGLALHGRLRFANHGIFAGSTADLVKNIVQSLNSGIEEPAAALERSRGVLAGL